MAKLYFSIQTKYQSLSQNHKGQFIFGYFQFLIDMSFLLINCDYQSELTDGLLVNPVPSFWPNPLSTLHSLSLVRLCDNCGFLHADGTTFWLAAATPVAPVRLVSSVGSVLRLLSSLLSVLVADSSLKDVVMVTIEGNLRRITGVCGEVKNEDY